MRTRLTHRSARVATAATLLTLGLPALASAQATRTWVSGVGDDANPCSRTAPCKTFAGAISKTAAKGEINVLDPGGFGAVTITKAITIDGGHSLSGVLVSGTNGIIINAGASDRVTLRNLDIDGVGTGLSGVKILAGGTVRVEKSTIYGFANAGIEVATSANTRVTVNDTTINNNSGPGFWSHPTGGTAFTAKSTITHSSIDDNAAGVVSDATASRTKITVSHTSINDNVAGNGTGVTATGIGAQAIGANGGIRLNDDEILGNTLGVQALTGGLVQTFGNNVITANETDGTISGTIPLT